MHGTDLARPKPGSQQWIYNGITGGQTTHACRLDLVQQPYRACSHVCSTQTRNRQPALGHPPVLDAVGRGLVGEAAQADEAAGARQRDVHQQDARLPQLPVVHGARQSRPPRRSAARNIMLLDREILCASPGKGVDSILPICDTAISTESTSALRSRKAGGPKLKSGGGEHFDDDIM